MLKRMLPQRVRTLREAMEVSQSGLARAADLSWETIKAIETGMEKGFSISTLEPLTGIFGVSMDYLLGYDKALTSWNRTSNIVYPVLSAENAHHNRCKCPDCDCVIKPGVPHSRDECLAYNHLRGAVGPDKIAEFYGVSLKEFFDALQAGKESIRKRRK